jgi:hypothetical protein
MASPEPNWDVLWKLFEYSEQFHRELEAKAARAPKVKRIRMKRVGRRVKQTVRRSA